jgi:hypothetical protein
MTLKSFCTMKGMASKLKRSSTKWEKIFASCTSNKGLVTEIYRELKKLNSQEINNPVKNRLNLTEQNFFKERSPHG